jgi:hypothetical protein
MGRGYRTERIFSKALDAITSRRKRPRRACRGTNLKSGTERSTPRASFSTLEIAIASSAILADIDYFIGIVCKVGHLFAV